MREKLNIRAELHGWVWTAHDSTLVGGSQRPPHTHQELEMNLVTAGQGRYLISGTLYNLVPGTLLWLFPRQPHVLAHHTADFEMIVAVFRPGIVMRSCRSGTSSCLKKNRPENVMNRTLNSRSRERLSALCEEVIAASTDPVWFNAGIAFLLRQCWSAFESSNDEPPRKVVHPAVDQAVTRLSNETEGLSLPILSQQCGLSYSRLCRVFKDQIGMSLLEFRDMRRLDNFRRLYGSGQNRTMLDCALEAGFGSYAQFYRIFKKHLAISPCKYRRSQYPGLN